MNLYGISNILVIVGSLSVAILVSLKDYKHKLTRIWALFAISVAMYGFGAYMVSTIDTADEAIFWWQISYIGIIAMPFLFLWFIYEFLNIKRPFIIKFFALATIMFLVVNFFSRKLFLAEATLFFTDLKFVKPIYFIYPIGPLLFVFIIFSFFGSIAYAHFELVKKYKNASGIERNQIRYFFLATALGFAGGSLSFLPCFNISFYPFFNFTVVLSPIIITYAILRHRLLDIEVIIRETAVFAGIFGFSVGVFVIAMVIGQQALEPFLGGRQWVVPALALFMVTIAVRPIERLIYNTIGKVLFKKRYEYQKTLQDAAIGMATIRDPRKLLQLITHIISMKMRVSHVSILIYDEKKEEYVIKSTRGKDKPSILYATVRADNILIEWMKEKRQPITLDEVQRWTRQGESNVAKTVLSADLEHIKERMQMLNAAVCVPSFYQDELLGILALGNKNSGDFFSQDDLNLFSALADEAAIALKNSQLYFEIDARAGEIEALYKHEHKLFMHASVAFAAAIDARDPYTHGHSERVTNYSLAILDHLGPTPETQDNPVFRQRLQIASVLHDIGKIGVPDSILHKPAKLNEKEIEAMERHPALGAEIVSHIKGLRDILGGIRHHHERYDGKGYPDRIKSDEIPFMARIIAVADTYDAMTSDRPYRNGLSDDIAKEEIKSNGSMQFDPYMVAAFLKAFESGRIRQSSRKSDGKKPTLGQVP